MFHEMLTNQPTTPRPSPYQRCFAALACRVPQEKELCFLAASFGRVLAVEYRRKEGKGIVTMLKVCKK
jgi:hypothetical protein